MMHAMQVGIKQARESHASSPLVKSNIEKTKNEPNAICSNAPSSKCVFRDKSVIYLLCTGTALFNWRHHIDDPFIATIDGVHSVALDSEGLVQYHTRSNVAITSLC